MSRSNNGNYWKRYAAMHWHFGNIAETSNPYEYFQNFNHRHDAPCKFTKSGLFYNDSSSQKGNTMST